MMHPETYRSAASFAVVIPAAGMSERMGSPKALLGWSPGLSFIEKIVKTYSDAGFHRIVCTLNPQTITLCQSLEHCKPAQLLLNPYPDRGRLFSLQLGLETVKDSPFCFVQNIDNPFVTAETIRHLMNECDPDAWISPEFQGKGGHPVVLPKALIHRILENMDPAKTLHDLLLDFPKNTVAVPDASVLININTPTDYGKFLPISMFKNFR